MISLGEQLASELDNVLFGEPWYGTSVYGIIRGLEDRNRLLKINRGNSCSGILMHMIAWTEEVLSRLNRFPASEPVRGDWPDPGELTVGELFNLLQGANSRLKDRICRLSDEELMSPIIDHRFPDGSGVSNLELIRGVIHHHIYHSGQLALLNKQTIEQD